MANEPGFMEQLTGSAVEEEAMVEQMISAQAPSKTFAQAEQAGQMMGAGLGSAAAGLASGFFQKDKGGSFMERANTAAQDARDRFTAGTLGIEPVDLKARRAIRQEMSAMAAQDDGTPSYRLKMAERAVEVAKRVGSPRQVQTAMATVDALRKEEMEWRKLNAETEAKEIDNLSDSVTTGFRADGTSVTGVLGKENGVAGLHTAAGFKPFVAGQFSLHDPEKGGARQGTTRDVHARLRDATTPSNLNKLRARASGAMESLVKTDRVLSTLTDLYEKGGVGSVIGASGKALTAVDNFVRNAKGFVNAFASKGMSEHNNSLRDQLLDGVKDGTNALLSLIELPEGVVKGSAAAQQHQAAIMEMAYMAARLAEPSNRGLSDNDIANALKRIAGGTSNPQVMARRFVEMQADAAAALEFDLDMFRGGALGDDISDEQVNKAILGGAYEKYIAKKDEIFEKYGVEMDDTGRARFAAGSKMGVDVEPGEGIGIDPTLEGATDVTDEAVFNEVFGDQG